MTQDLFQKKSAKDRLLDHMKKVKVMKTSDVIRWGLENHSNRADRNMRQLAADGAVRRMDDAEKERRCGDIREDVWIFNDHLLTKGTLF